MHMSKHMRHKAAAHGCGILKVRKRNPEEEPPESYSAYYKVIYILLPEAFGSPLEYKLN